MLHLHTVTVFTLLSINIYCIDSHNVMKNPNFTLKKRLYILFLMGVSSKKEKKKEIMFMKKGMLKLSADYSFNWPPE